MNIRYATTDDLDIITELEAKALPILTPYVKVAKDYYFKKAKGEILLVEKEGVPVAMGRYTLMPDNTIWIETIRVDPEHQREGIGTLIYSEIEKIARKLKVSKMAMYTEDFNVGSMALVNQMEFTKVGIYGCLKLEMSDDTYNSKNFVPVKDIKEIQHIIDESNWDDKISLNRTFYDLNSDILKEFIDRGDIYSDGKSVVLEGNRTREDGEQSMGMYLGSVQDCIDAGVSIAHNKGMDSILAIYPKSRTDILEALEERDFEDTYDLHVFEKYID